MIGELKGVRLLQGFRGQPPADVAALADVIDRLGRDRDGSRGPDRGGRDEPADREG